MQLIAKKNAKKKLQMPQKKPETAKKNLQKFPLLPKTQHFPGKMVALMFWGVKNKREKKREGGQAYRQGE